MVEGANRLFLFAIKKQINIQLVRLVAQKSFRTLHVRQLNHKETQQPRKSKVKRLDKIEKRQVSSTPGQGPPKLMFAYSISSAVKLYKGRDYSEEWFLHAWRQQVCDWGEPSLVYSDRGTQLVSGAACLDPKDIEDTVDWGKVERKTGVKWIFTSPVTVAKWPCGGTGQGYKAQPENNL